VVLGCDCPQRPPTSQRDRGPRHFILTNSLALHISPLSFRAIHSTTCRHNGVAGSLGLCKVGRIQSQARPLILRCSGPGLFHWRRASNCCHWAGVSQQLDEGLHHQPKKTGTNEYGTAFVATRRHQSSSTGVPRPVPRAASRGEGRTEEMAAGHGAGVHSPSVTVTSIEKRPGQGAVIGVQSLVNPCRQKGCKAFLGTDVHS
jgi:hypothetical protein